MTIAIVGISEDPFLVEIDDASVTALVRMSLRMYKSTRTSEAQVYTSHGVVMISGVAVSAEEKSQVSRLVGNINGVSQVVNEMTLAESVR